VASGYLRAARQLQLAAPPPPSGTPSLQQLTQTVALMQHHDAITGTDRFVVNQDYRRLLAAGICSAA
jgi:Alpha mannosidase middle domain